MILNEIQPGIFEASRKQGELSFAIVKSPKHSLGRKWQIFYRGFEKGIETDAYPNSQPNTRADVEYELKKMIKNCNVYQLGLVGNLGDCEAFEAIDFQAYKINHNPKPIPTSKFDWDFQHEDYDGAIDAYDTRCGIAKSREACLAEIIEIESGR